MISGTMNVVCLLLVFGCSFSYCLWTTPVTAEYQPDLISQRQSCPPWLDHGEDDCRCEPFPTDSERFLCGKNESVKVRFGTCITWDDAINRSLITDCPYFSDSMCEDSYYQIPSDVPSSNLTSVVCSQFHRQGVHCGHCTKGYGPAPLLNGANISCAKCYDYNYIWILYLLLQLFMITVLYFTFVFCEVKGISSPLSVLAYFYQLIINAVISNTRLFSSIVCILRNVFAQIVLSIYAFWNLDFFRLSLPPTCVSSSMSNVQVLLFDYVIAFFPIFLTFMSYLLITLHNRNVSILVLLWRPIDKLISCFSNKTSNPLESILSTFATFLLLSYSKILFTSISFLYGVPVFDNNENSVKGSPVLFYDASIQYFGRTHILYVCLSIMSIVVFNVFPPTILALYTTKFFKSCLGRCGFRHWHSLAIIMDVFQGWYKDGTEGTRDYRAFSALYMVLRMSLAGEFIIILFIGNGLSTQYSNLTWVIPSIVHISLGCFYLTVKPYKKNWMNVVDGLVLVVMGVVCLSLQLVPTIAILLTTFPLIATLLFATWRLFQRLIAIRCFASCCAKATTFLARMTFLQIQNNEDGFVDTDRHRLLESAAGYRGSYTPL